MDTPGEDDILHQVRNYRKTVLIYEALNQKISALLSNQEMTDAEIEEYRSLARQRDELLNEIRWMEQQLMVDEDDPIQ